MKLQPDKFDVQTISGYGPGWIARQRRKNHRTAWCIGSRGERIDWDCAAFEELPAAHFDAAGRNWTPNW